MLSQKDLKGLNTHWTQCAYFRIDMDRIVPCHWKCVLNVFGNPGFFTFYFTLNCKIVCLLHIQENSFKDKYMDFGYVLLKLVIVK